MKIIKNLTSCIESWKRAIDLGCDKAMYDLGHYPDNIPQILGIA